MEFIEVGEKIKRLRKQLGMTQEDLQAENVTRGLISMIETGKREVTYSVSIKLADKFNKKASELDFTLNVDADYLMRSPKEDAKLYCLAQLKDNEISQEKIYEVLGLAEKYELLEVKAKAKFKLGEICEEDKKYDEACNYYNEATEIYKIINKEKDLANIWFRMARTKEKSLQYDAAIVYLNLSSYYAVAYENKEIQKLCLYNLANDYKRTNRIELSINMVDKCIELCTEEDEEIFIYAQGIKATCYEARGEFTEAISIYKEIINKISNNKNKFIGYAYTNLGNLYTKLNKFKDGMKYFNKAEEFRANEDKINLSHTIMEKSDVFVKQKLYDEAIELVQKGIKYAENYEDTEYIIKGYTILEEIYLGINDSSKLEEVYLKLIEILVGKNDKVRLKIIYDKIALMYSRKKKIDNCTEYLILSNNLN